MLKTLRPFVKIKRKVMSINKFLPYLLEHYINPIIIFIVCTAILSVDSDVSNNVIFSSLKQIPSIYYKGGIVFGILWVVCILIYNHIKKQRDYSPAFVKRASPRHGWKELGPVEHKSILWTVRIPQNSRMSGRSKISILDDIDIKIPPECPECNTELVEKKNIIGFYTWSCPHPKCNFKNGWNKNSWDTEKSNVKKIVKRDMKSEIRAKENS